LQSLFHSLIKHIALKFLFLFCTAALITSCGTKNTEPTGNTLPTNFHGIPPGGTGGDSLLNMKKNRWSAPQNYSDISISDFINLPHDILSAIGSEERYKWIPAASAQAETSEAKSVRITGYLISVKEEGNESCNGNDSNYHDFHLWIADSSGKIKSQSIIAEATPFWKEQFPKWQLTMFESLDHTKVRISGWIMWDEDHPKQLGSSRTSLWEIHPITKFEYYSDGNWQVL
jgi:hypothetical protein